AKSRFSKPSVYPRAAEKITVLLEVDAIPADHDAFRTQPKPLLEAGRSGQENLSARAEHAMPRHSFSSGPQRPDHLAGSARMPARRRHVAISRNSTFWDPPDRGEHLFEHHFVRYCASIST